MITWRDKVENLTKTLGRRPELNELLDLCKDHEMTMEEVEAQRQSWARGMMARCEHGELDFEQCPRCRVRRDRKYYV